MKYLCQFFFNAVYLAKKGRIGFVWPLSSVYMKKANQNFQNLTREVQMKVFLQHNLLNGEVLFITVSFCPTCFHHVIFHIEDFHDSFPKMRWSIVQKRQMELWNLKLWF